VYRSLRDPKLFFLNSRWRDEAAFEVHVGLPATRAFVERAQRLIDHSFDVTRTRLL
jgi:quinol monooxygenase YgiN